MRIGIYPSWCDQKGNFLDAAGVAERARMVEASGLDGLWQGDHLPTPSTPSTMPALGMPDTLMLLGISAAATTSIEIGTNIYCIPQRNRYDVLQRLYTLETLFPRRFTIGVGTGSGRGEYDAIGVPWDERFHLLHDAIHEMRGMCKPPAEGVVGTTDPSMVGTWAQIVGLPRLLLGAWNSGPQLKRAATEYDGWITSGYLGLEGVGWKKSFRDAIKKYRDLGGGRAMVSTIQLDLRRKTTELDDSGTFNLYCPPEVASERLHFLEELGYDDVIVNRVEETPKVRAGAHTIDYTLDDLEEIRSLLPKAEPIAELRP